MKLCHFLENITDERKHKICHELSLEFAKIESARKVESTHFFSSFELHERLLCHYAWCYQNMMKNFDKTLKKYDKAMQEARESLAPFMNK